MRNALNRMWHRALQVVMAGAHSFAAGLTFRLGVCRKPALAKRAGVWALLVTLVFLLLPQDLWARRGGRVSFGRSSSFSRPSSRSFPSRANSWGSSRPTTVTPRMGSRGESRPATSRAYGVDQSVLNRARAQGTVFQSRGDAQRAFERDNANKFPSTFSREPANRPAYIPSTTTVDSNYVRYNSQQGGVPICERRLGGLQRPARHGYPQHADAPEQLRVPHEFPIRKRHLQCGGRQCVRGLVLRVWKRPANPAVEYWRLGDDPAAPRSPPILSRRATPIRARSGRLAASGRAAVTPESFAKGEVHGLHI